MQYNIRSLQIFECVYRRRGLAAAAAELGVTPSAVSHQLKALREQIGEELFVKRGRNLDFTDRGRHLAESLKHAFAEIESSVRHGSADSQQFLRATMCSGFGLGWFIPKLEKSPLGPWQDCLHIRMHTGQVDLTDSVADVFFSTTRLKSGYWSAKLFDELLVVVGKQDSGSRNLITHEVDDTSIASDWAAFTATTGFSSTQTIDDAALLGASHYIFGLEMAISGMGLALVPDFLAERPLQEGRLTLKGNHRFPTGRAYYINVKHSRRHEPLVRDLCSWVLKNAKACRS